jgi:hypothetical protein
MELSMKLRFLAAFGLVAASWSLSAAATSYSAVCNGCTAAQTLALVQGSAYGDHFVYDMLNRTITHYSVQKGKDIDHQVITKVAITPSVQTQFNWVQQLFDVTQTLDVELTYDDSAATKAASLNTLHTSAVISVPLVAAESTSAGAQLSAFDLINTPANQLAALNRGMSSQTYWDNANLAIRTALATFTSHFVATQAIYPVPVNISVTFIFGDLSTAKFTWNVNTNQWDYVPGASRDSQGNPIPENPDQAVGAANRQNYVFPDTAGGVSAAYRQAQNFTNIGLPVGVPVFRSGSNWTVACVRVGGTDGTVSCTVVPI